LVCECLAGGRDPVRPERHHPPARARDGQSSGRQSRRQVMILRSLAVFIASGLLSVSMADTAVVGGDTEVFTQKTGQEIYDQVCISCHMAGGKGAEGAGKYPALANNPKLAAAGYPIFMVMRSEERRVGNDCRAAG